MIEIICLFLTLYIYFCYKQFLRSRVLFTLTFHDEDTDSGVEEHFYINVPIDLELRFTSRKFNSWIKEMRSKRDASRLVSDTETLRSIFSRYSKSKRDCLINDSCKRIVKK